MDIVAWVKYWSWGVGEEVAAAVAVGWDGELLAKAVKDVWKVGAGIGWEICWIGWEAGWEACWIGWVGCWGGEVAGEGW